MNTIRLHLGHTENSSHCLVMKSGVPTEGGGGCLVGGPRELSGKARTTQNMVTIGFQILRMSIYAQTHHSVHLRYGHFVNKVCLSDGTMRRDGISQREAGRRPHNRVLVRADSRPP